MCKAITMRARSWWLGACATLWTLLVPTLTVLGQAATDGDPAQAVAVAEGSEVVLHEANFQPYVFWAYGLACALLFIFTVWTAQHGRRLEERIRNLEERLQEARRTT